MTSGGQQTCTNNSNFSQTSGNGTVLQGVVIPIAGTAINNGSFSLSAGTGSIVQGAVLQNGGTVVNNGAMTLSAQSGIVEVVRIFGDGSITNAGTVNVTNIGGTIGGAFTTGNGSISNSGTFTVINTGVLGSANGLSVGGTGTITNSGNLTAIATPTGFATGLFIGGGGLIVNTGSLTVTAGTAQGIALNGAGTIVNSGSVVVTSPGGVAQAIQLLGPNETFTNYGTVVASGGPGSSAVSLSGSDTLVNAAGSRLVGAISVSGSGNAINFLGGNFLLTASTLAGVTVSASGAPFVVSGNQIAVVDPTPFGLADKTLMDFTRGISSILGSLGGASATPNAPISSAFASESSVTSRVGDAFAAIPALAYAGDAMVFKNPTVVTADGRSVWARGFGGEHTQDADGLLVGSRTTFAGGAAGFDLVARPGLRLGAFLGAGQSRTSLDLNLGSTNTNTGFGGVYGRWSFMTLSTPSFIDFALHGGGSTNSTSRTVSNNLAPNGIEIATGRYNNSYVSPEVKYGVNVPVGTQFTLTPSAQIRYVAGFFGGYTEAGTAAPLTVGRRTLQDIEERGEVKLTRAMPVGADLLLASIYVGALGLQRLGDTTVNTVLLGASLPFATPGRSSVAGVLGGGGLEWRVRNGVSVFGAAEAIGMSDSGTVITARGGLRVPF